MRWLAAVLALAAIGLAAQPRKSPEFVIYRPDGTQLLLSQYRGKVVALEFLYTTCVYCQQTSQLMNKLQAEYGPKGFQAIGVAFNEYADKLSPPYARQFRLTYPVGHSSRREVTYFLGVPEDHALNVPQMVFIDRNGMIQQQSAAKDSDLHSEANMRRIIEGLLKAGTPSPAKKAPAKKAS